jgi:hypothetical protein
MHNENLSKLKSKGKLEKKCIDLCNLWLTTTDMQSASFLSDLPISLK